MLKKTIPMFLIESILRRVLFIQERHRPVLVYICPSDNTTIRVKDAFEYHTLSIINRHTDNIIGLYKDDPISVICRDILVTMKQTGQDPFRRLYNAK